MIDPLSERLPNDNQASAPPCLTSTTLHDAPSGRLTTSAREFDEPVDLTVGMTN